MIAGDAVAGERGKLAEWIEHADRGMVEAHVTDLLVAGLHLNRAGRALGGLNGGSLMALGDRLTDLAAEGDRWLKHGEALR